MSYDVPEWSDNPVGEFKLEVLKDGKIVEEIQLSNKQFFIMGRQPDVVDIQMDHPSISRRHAVLNFRNDNALMLRDLESAQGTFLNKKRCDKDVYYRVYVGDMIRFGGSTRHYILCGPEEQRPPEYESENVIQLRETIVKKRVEHEKRKEQEENEGISWGFREDAVETYSDEEVDDKDKVELPDYLKDLQHMERKIGDKFEADIRDDEARNEKDKAILEKIRKKELKIQHMQEENRKIYNKEGNQDNGLTDGQLAAVARNDVNVKKLSEEISELIHTIKAKNIQRAEYERKQETLGSSGGTAGGGGLDESTVNRKRILEAKGLDDIEHDTTGSTADISTNWRMRKKLAKTLQYL